jgi:hypothetical protein
MGSTNCGAPVPLIKASKILHMLAALSHDNPAGLAFGHGLFRL